MQAAGAFLVCAGSPRLPCHGPANARAARLGGAARHTAHGGLCCLFFLFLFSRHFFFFFFFFFPTSQTGPGLRWNASAAFPLLSFVQARRRLQPRLLSPWRLPRTLRRRRPGLAAPREFLWRPSSSSSSCHCRHNAAGRPSCRTGGRCGRWRRLPAVVSHAQTRVRPPGRARPRPAGRPIVFRPLTPAAGPHPQGAAVQRDSLRVQRRQRARVGARHGRVRLHAARAPRARRGRGRRTVRRAQAGGRERPPRGGGHGREREREVSCSPHQSFFLSSLLQWRRPGRPLCRWQGRPAALHDSFVVAAGRRKIGVRIEEKSVPQHVGPGGKRCRCAHASGLAPAPPALPPLRGLRACSCAVRRRRSRRQPPLLVPGLARWTGHRVRRAYPPLSCAVRPCAPT